MVQESTSRPVEGDTAWLSCHRKISGLDKSKAASHTSSSFSSTERQRSTRRAFGWVEEVAAWKRSMPKAHSVKEVMPRDTNCGDEDVGSQSLQECWHFVSSMNDCLKSSETATKTPFVVFSKLSSITTTHRPSLMMLQTMYDACSGMKYLVNIPVKVNL